MRSSFTNADLVECVLVSLPDFRCLASTILTSKTIYNVFQQHPRSVVRSVAYNLVGPALPQALRLVRCQNAQLYSKPIDELLGEDDIQKNPALSSEDIISLVAISACVQIQELESLFSWRMKDRRFKTSQLSLAESTRFQKAMYRLCLFSAAYGCKAYQSVLEPDSDLEEVESALEAARTLRKGFFDSFSTPELRDIQRVEMFLRGIIARAEGDCFTTIPPATYSPESSYALYCAPHKVIDVYKEGLDCIDICEEEDEELFFHNFMDGPLTSVLADRKEPNIIPVKQKQAIIDEVIGEHDRCSQCQSDIVQGLDLWGPSNWSYLWDTPPLYSITQLLKGYVSANLADKAHFTTVLRETSAAELVEGLFDYKTPAYYTWNKEDWLCRQCLEKLMRDHLHIWYLGQKVKRGDVIPGNCWYGYNCRTQTHKLEHAQKLNHWCEPIKGDAPPTNI